MVKFEVTIESHSVRLDDPKTKFETRFNNEGSLSSLDFKRDKIPTLWEELVHFRLTFISMLLRNINLQGTLAHMPDIPFIVLASSDQSNIDSSVYA